MTTIRREQVERKQHDNYGGGGDDCDMFSDTTSLHSSRVSSTGSRNTAKTHRSSKNRRKHERKLLSLKPGNPFEDIALIDALHTTACKAFDHQLSVRGVARALIDLHLDAEGAELQRVFGKLLKTIRDGLDEIWIPEMVVSGHVSTGENANIDYVQLQDEQHYAMISEYFYCWCDFIK